MSVRFKFRSSATFDSVDLGGRQSISVRDLRKRILALKKLQIGGDFDLLISDADTGAVFEDEELQIKEGSSVVIKRVPAGSSAPRYLDVANVARNDGGHVETTPTAQPVIKDVDKENFDDFGVDLYPILQSDPVIADLEFTYKKEKDNVILRCDGASVSKCNGSDLSEAMSKEVIGDNCCRESGAEEIQEHFSVSKKEMYDKLDVGMTFPTTLDMDLPTELRCSLCGAIFNNAVMIPCCQHSFCEKCIRLELVRRGRCPKCSSTKCTVEALLPNLSLRQAIEHFLEAQAANNALENKLPQDVPDVESGIHMKEVSCAISTHKKEPMHPHSPSVTGKGSNQVMPGVYENNMAGWTRKSTLLPFNMKQMKRGEGNSAEGLNRMVDFDGVHSSSKLPENFLHEEVNMATLKPRRLDVTVVDGSRSLMPSSRQRKGDRNCYMCGSPDHLIRDCPEASNSYPYNQTGDTQFAGGMYGQAYWHGNAFPQARPYGSMYSTTGMMPFDPAVPGISPFGFYPYTSSMYPGMPRPYGFMNLGGRQPPQIPCTQQALREPQNGKLQHKSVNRHPEREHNSDHISEDYHYKGSRTTSHERRHHVNNETAGSFSEDGSPRVHKKHSGNKHGGSFCRELDIPPDEEVPSVRRRHERGPRHLVSGRDEKARHSEKSNPEVLSDNSSQHSRERKRQHDGSHLKKGSERRERHGSDFTPKSHHQSREEILVNDKVVSDHKKQSHRHHNHSGSSFEHNVSCDRRHCHKEKDISHSSRSSRKMTKSKDDWSEYEKREMVEGLKDEDRRIDYQKRRRTH